jgi:hypothetical protein
MSRGLMAMAAGLAMSIGAGAPALPSIPSFESKAGAWRGYRTGSGHSGSKKRRDLGRARDLNKLARAQRRLQKIQRRGH